MELVALIAAGALGIMLTFLFALFNDKKTEKDTKTKNQKPEQNTKIAEEKQQNQVQTIQPHHTTISYAARHEPHRYPHPLNQNINKDPLTQQNKGHNPFKPQNTNNHIILDGSRPMQPPNPMPMQPPPIPMPPAITIVPSVAAPMPMPHTTTIMPNRTAPIPQPDPLIQELKKLLSQDKTVKIKSNYTEKLKNLLLQNGLNPNEYIEKNTLDLDEIKNSTGKSIDQVIETIVDTKNAELNKPLPQITTNILDTYLTPPNDKTQEITVKNDKTFSQILLQHGIEPEIVMQDNTIKPEFGKTTTEIAETLRKIAPQYKTKILLKQLMSKRIVEKFTLEPDKKFTIKSGKTNEVKAIMEFFGNNEHKTKLAIKENTFPVYTDTITLKDFHLSALEQDPDKKNTELVTITGSKDYIERFTQQMSQHIDNFTVEENKQFKINIGETDEVKKIMRSFGFNEKEIKWAITNNTWPYKDTIRLDKTVHIDKLNENPLKDTTIFEKTGDNQYASHPNGQFKYEGTIQNEQFVTGILTEYEGSNIAKRIKYHNKRTDLVEELTQDQQSKLRDTLRSFLDNKDKIKKDKLTELQDLFEKYNIDPEVYISKDNKLQFPGQTDRGRPIINTERIIAMIVNEAMQTEKELKEQLKKEDLMKQTRETQAMLKAAVTEFENDPSKEKELKYASKGLKNTEKTLAKLEQVVKDKKKFEDAKLWMQKTKELCAQWQKAEVPKEEAATKIQKVFRDHKARKQAKEAKKAAEEAKKAAEEAKKADDKKKADLDKLTQSRATLIGKQTITKEEREKKITDFNNLIQDLQKASHTAPYKRWHEIEKTIILNNGSKDSREYKITTISNDEYSDKYCFKNINSNLGLIIWINHGDENITPQILYIGEFQDDKKHGYGIEYNYTLEEYYAGEFKDDKKHGYGVEYNTHNDYKEGIWERDTSSQEQQITYNKGVIGYDYDKDKKTHKTLILEENQIPKLDPSYKQITALFSQTIFAENDLKATMEIDREKPEEEKKKADDEAKKKAATTIQRIFREDKARKEAKEAKKAADEAKKKEPEPKEEGRKPAQPNPGEAVLNQGGGEELEEEQKSNIANPDGDGEKKSISDAVADDPKPEEKQKEPKPGEEEKGHVTNDEPKNIVMPTENFNINDIKSIKKDSGKIIITKTKDSTHTFNMEDDRLPQEIKNIEWLRREKGYKNNYTVSYTDNSEYTGPLDDNLLRQGKGVFRKFADREAIYIYEGDFKDNKYNGFGEINEKEKIFLINKKHVYRNWRNVYKGNFKDNKYNGFGECVVIYNQYNKSNKYTGHFINGHLDILNSFKQETIENSITTSIKIVDFDKNNDTIEKIETVYKKNDKNVDEYCRTTFFHDKNKNTAKHTLTKEEYNNIDQKFMQSMKPLLGSQFVESAEVINPTESFGGGKKSDQKPTTKLKPEQPNPENEEAEVGETKEKPVESKSEDNEYSDDFEEEEEESKGRVNFDDEELELPDKSDATKKKPEHIKVPRLNLSSIAQQKHPNP